MNSNEKFFKNGFISPLNILSQREANYINNEYHIFLNSRSLKNSYIVEHKSKSHLFFPWAKKLIFNEKILDHVSKILGKNFFCWNSLIFYKKPNSNAFVSMHQDQNYWGIKHDKSLTVGLAISDSNENNGCLKVLPNSHRKNFKHHDFEKKDNMLARGQTINFTEENKDNLLNIILKAGQCCIIHGNIVHGSYENRSNKPRFIFAMRFLTPDNLINKKLYYNNATLVSGVDKYNNFIKEPILLSNNQKKIHKLHKEILIKQFSKYLKLKIKFSFLCKIFMIFLEIDFLRGMIYKLAGKTKL